jgi:hypothetical protein
MTAQQTTTTPQSTTDAQAALERAITSYDEILLAHDATPADIPRAAVARAAEERHVAEARLKLAQKRDADAASAKAEADHQTKLDELAKLNAANTQYAALASIAPEVTELREIAKRLVAIRASLKTKRGAFHAGHEHGKRLAAALGAHVAPPPYDQNTFQGIARAAAEEAVSPPFRAAGLSVRVFLDELEL